MLLAICIDEDCELLLEYRVRRVVIQYLDSQVIQNLSQDRQ